MMTHSETECFWCRKALGRTRRGWPLCARCQDLQKERCLRVARAVWSDVPWGSRLDLALAGQHVDVRFLFEVNDLGLERELRELRVELLGTEAPADKHSLSTDDALYLARQYAPKRDFTVEKDLGGAQAILGQGLGSKLEYFVDEIRQAYMEFTDQPGFSEDLGGVFECAHELLDQLLPSGPVFEKCLRLAVPRHLAPHCVFLQSLFGDPVVERPWHPTVDGEFRWQQPRNSGPYLGRLPPARWKALGLGQCMQNLIRVWTCRSLERTGLGARAALGAWNQLGFHDNLAELYTDRTTSPAERNYKRDKDWLRRRLKLMRSPFADLDLPPGLLQPMGLDFEKAGLSWDEYVEFGKRLFAIDYFPDI
jgi:hypothetical protein